MDALAEVASGGRINHAALVEVETNSDEPLYQKTCVGDGMAWQGQSVATESLIETGGGLEGRVSDVGYMAVALSWYNGKGEYVAWSTSQQRYIAYVLWSHVLKCQL